VSSEAGIPTARHRSLDATRGPELSTATNEVWPSPGKHAVGWIEGARGHARKTSAGTPRSLVEFSGDKVP